jgi:hypothetical protein
MRSKDVPILKLMVRNGLKWDAVDNSGRSLLTVACEYGSLVYCQIILDGLSTQGRVKDMLAYKDKSGKTPLFMSVIKGFPEICHVLFKFGSDARIVCRFGSLSMTSFDLAYQEGNEEIVQMMLGFPDTCGDISQWLYLPASRGKVEVCRL